MNAKRLMAKMTARGLVIGNAVGGSVEVSRADVAAGLSFAGVGVTADRLIRWAYCDDVCQEPLLVAALVSEIRKVVGCDRAMRYRLVRLALRECFHHRLCQTCNGATTVAAKVCTVCHGSGLKAWSQRARAAELCLTLSTFQRVAESDANAVYQYVVDLEQDALSALAKQFSERAA